MGLSVGQQDGLQGGGRTGLPAGPLLGPRGTPGAMETPEMGTALSTTIGNKLEARRKRWKDKEWGKKLKVHKKGKGEQMKNCVIVSKETFDWNA